MYLAFNAPHTPLQALRSDYDALAELKDHRLRVYGGMIRALDRNVGLVLDALKAHGLEENTLVIFTSDNGGANYVGLPDLNKPFRGWKATFFEGGIHVPFFMKWPGGLPKSVRYEQPVGHVDIFSTAAAAAAAALPTDRVMDGVDLAAFVADPAKGAPHKSLFWRDGDYKVLLAGDWKLQTLERPRKIWLHNLRADPTEKRNLADAMPEKVRELQQELVAIDAQQVKPLWPTLLEAPVLIDRPLGTPPDKDDEFIYSANYAGVHSLARDWNKVFRRMREPRRVVIALASGLLLGTVAVAAAGLMVARPPDMCLAASDRPGTPDAGMQWIAGGRFAMGSEQFRAEEAPVRDAYVAGFWIDTYDVTNAQFARFVRETGYVTTAERTTSASGVPAGSMLFSAPRNVHDGQDIRQWWRVERAPTGATRKDRVAIFHTGNTIPSCMSRMKMRKPTPGGLAARCRRKHNGSSLRVAAAMAMRSFGARRRIRMRRPRRTTGANFPGAQSRQQRLEGHVASRLLSGQWAWALRHGRKCLAMDPRHMDRQPPAEQGREAPANERGRKRSANEQAGRRRKPSAVLRDQRWIVPVCHNLCMRYRPAARQPGDGSSGASHIGFRTVLVP